MTKSGVYRIDCIANGRFYVGSTVNFNQRWVDHKKQLRAGTHPNIYLTRIYHKYGLDALRFSVVEICTPEQLIEREQHYIDTLNPEINIARVAGNTLGTKRSDEHKKWQRQNQSRPIYQIDYKTGDIIAEFTSAREVKRSLGVNNADIGIACRSHGERTAAGYMWWYKDEWDINKFIPKAPRTSKRVVCVDSEGRETVYLSAEEAARALNLPSSNSIGQVARRARKSYKGYTFRYLEYDK